MHFLERQKQQDLKSIWDDAVAEAMERLPSFEDKFVHPRYIVPIILDNKVARIMDPNYQLQRYGMFMMEFQKTILNGVFTGWECTQEFKLNH